MTAAAFSFGEKLVARAEEALTPSEILSKEIQLDASSDIDALRAKFLKFATVNEDGESLMTFDDFARAHLNGSCASLYTVSLYFASASADVLSALSRHHRHTRGL